MKTKAQIHGELCEKMHSVYEAKNHDYGDSFSKLRKKFPDAILVRLNDKLSRLEVLMSGENAKVKDESINDTLLDLANYAIMELTEREAEKQRQPGGDCKFRAEDHDPGRNLTDGRLHCDQPECLFSFMLGHEEAALCKEPCPFEKLVKEFLADE